MTNLMFFLLSTHAQAASTDEALSSTRSSAPLPTAKTDAGVTIDWYVGEQDSPRNEVYSTSDIYGLGAIETDSMNTAFTTGSASASTMVEDSGSVATVSWEKSAENSHSSSWRFSDLKSRGVSWTYTGSAGHEVETQLSAPECGTDAPGLDCMIEVVGLGMSGIRENSTGGAGGVDGAGGTGGAGGMGGGSDDAEDPHEPAYLVVEERSSFRMLVSFSASVGVDTTGLGLGGHASTFGVSVSGYDSGAIMLDHDARPISLGWSLTAEEDASTRQSEIVEFTLDPGEYVLDVDVSDDTWSMGISNPSIPDSTSAVSSQVRASVVLSPW